MTAPVDLLHAEWTKFRTVRGRLLAAALAALLTAGLGLLMALGSASSCMQGPVEVACPVEPLGPDGEAVRDKFYFTHRTLTGHGSVTARITSLTGVITYPPPDHDEIVPGVVPWAKAGVLVKDGLLPGSGYTSVLVTGAHGVRMQHDFTGDTAGGPDGVAPGAPRWVRLTRSGGVLTGAESADGERWTTVGAVPDALPATVEIGLFVTSPSDVTVETGTSGTTTSAGRLATATAVFDRIDVQGAVSPGWRHDDVGAVLNEAGVVHHPGSATESDGTVTISGNGDIAPHTTLSGGPGIEIVLVGQLVGLVLLIVAAASSTAVEHRTGLVRTTLLAEPRRGRALGAAVVVPLGTAILRGGGTQVLPVGALTELRVVVGTGVLFGLVAVLAGALGSLLRRGVVAVLAAVALVVLPVMLATAATLPDAVVRWLLRLTPAAGFAIQQSTPEYPQVLAHYVPVAGYYPLPPWGGLAVLSAFAALALGLAVRRLQRSEP